MTTIPKRGWALVALATMMAAPLFTSSAHAGHDVSGYIAPSGLDFLSAQVPEYVPDHLAPPALTMDMLTCPGGRVVTMTQRNTDIGLNVRSSVLSVPARDVLRLELRFDVDASGEAYVEYPYACFGSATCGDRLTVVNGRATVDLRVYADQTGRARVAVSGVELFVNEDDIAFALSDCAIDDVVNWVIDFAKGWLLDMLLDKLEGIAQDQLAPFVETTIGGFMQVDGTFAIADFAASITDIKTREVGLYLDADVDLSSRFAADPCAGTDPGEPAPHVGNAPDMTFGTPADLGVSANLGLVDDALYHVWHAGLMCMTPERLAGLGLDVDLNEVVSLLPGFGVGVDVDMRARLATPPRVTGQGGDAATLTIALDQLEVALIGTAPDGTVTTVELEADAHATAVVAVDPAVNALVIRMQDVVVTRLAMNDAGAEATGLDVARMHQVAESILIPALMDDLGSLPITGPIFGLGEYYVLLREVRTTRAHLVAMADLFRAPAEDDRAPDTRVLAAPTGVVNPTAARITVTGSDDKIPAELLQYVVTIDGVAAAPTYVTEVAVGAAATTATYRVQVAAVDLHGNRDPSPAVVDVTVDGVRPGLTVLTDPILQLAETETTASIEWRADDDLTEAAALRPRVELYRLRSAVDILDMERVGQVDLAPGQDSAVLAVERGMRYRVIVTVEDEAGNASSSSILVHVAGEPAGCGCAVEGGRGNVGALLPLLLAVCALVRRRR